MASPPLVLSTEDLTIKRSKTDSLFSRGSIPGKNKASWWHRLLPVLALEKSNLYFPSTNSMRILFIWTAPTGPFCCSRQATSVIQESVFQKSLFVYTRNHQAWVLSLYPSFLGWMCFPSLLRFGLVFFYISQSSQQLSSIWKWNLIMHFIFILLIFFMDGIGWIILLRFCPCLKELLFQEEAPDAVFLIVCPYFCSWDVWRSQDKTCKPARFLKREADQLRNEKNTANTGILPI